MQLADQATSATSKKQNAALGGSHLEPGCLAVDIAAALLACHRRLLGTLQQHGKQACTSDDLLCWAAVKPYGWVLLWCGGVGGMDSVGSMGSTGSTAQHGAA